MMNRIDNRSTNQLRSVTFEVDYILYPEGSVLISSGQTKVICNVSILKEVPGWMKSQEKSGGWVTAEYSMLPRSTHTRRFRERTPKGRTQEISRLIGRSLRKAVDLSLLDGYTCSIDCDVIQADGGTRTASVTGAYVALAIALGKKIRDRILPENVLLDPVGAVSVGIVNGHSLLDLCYEEDVLAEVDLNVVANEKGALIEIQGTAEGNPFERTELNSLLDLAQFGISKLIDLQKGALTDYWKKYDDILST